MVDSSGVDNTEDLFSIKSATNMMKKMGKMDPETREVMRETIRLFIDAIKKMQSDNREQRRETRRENRRKKNPIDIPDSKV